MKVIDVMTAQVRTALESDDVMLAMKIMVGDKVSGLPVLDDQGHLVGMLTEGDLLRRNEIGTDRQRPRWLEAALGSRRMAQDYLRTHSRRVGDLMTPRVVSIDEGAPLSDAVQLMEKHGIKRLVVTHAGRLIGILSRSDLLRALIQATQMRDDPARRTDELIEACIDKEVSKCPWVSRSAMHIAVKDGAVAIDGVVTDEKVRDAIRVLVENVPGVRSVKNRLSVDGPAGSYF